MWKLVSTFVLLLGQAVAAQPDLARHEFTEVHMGMPVRVVLHAGSDSVARAAARAAFRRIAELDNTFSDYRPQSEVRRMEARSGEWVAVSADLFHLIGRAVEVARLTDGAFDPTVAPIVALWREARRTSVLPRQAQLDSARARVGWRRIALDTAGRAVKLDRGMRLDFGGIAKGYILDQARAALKAGGVDAMLIEAGGDIVVGAAPPGAHGWKIEAPGASAAFAAQLQAVTHAAVSTSGPTVQFVEIDGIRYSHVVDPRTGMALTNGVLIYVRAKDPTLADAIATALTVTGTFDLVRRFPSVVADVVAVPPE
ncbi:MAG: FAD:protein FMN transferase [Gemmatimonadaceae bacterium]